jgi:serine/threonine protein kinase
VAIKVIDLKELKDRFAHEMLQGEIQAIRTLNHQNILHCYDVFTTVNNCYIIMEFCNEGDLAGYLRKRSRLSEEEACRLLADIVAGFAEMARSGYLHRDIKLANILLKNGTAKIADFGFAKLET